MRKDTADEGFAYDRAGLEEALDLLAEAVGNPSRLPVNHPAELPLPTALPETGLGETAALHSLAPLALKGAALVGAPGFLAHMDPPTPWITWATALWAASRNQNLLHPESAPVARQLESRVIDWLEPSFGMDGGHMVPGSSVANLTALWAARDLAGVRTVVASEMAHLSIHKAAKILGLELRLLPVDDRHRLRLDQAGDLSSAALVLTAGTVATGAIDPIDAAPEACWVHVDAAWAGPLRLSTAHRALLDGVQRADSVSTSAHKWLFQPKEAGIVLFRDSARAHEALSFGSGYLAVPNVGILGSHGSSALPLLATLLAWGRQGIAERIDHCMRLAEQLASAVADEDTLELYGPPTTGIVLWRPRADVELAAVRSALDHSFVSITEFAGQRWFRSVAANPMADPESIVSDMVAAIQKTAG